MKAATKTPETLSELHQRAYHAVDRIIGGYRVNMVVVNDPDQRYRLERMMIKAARSVRHLSNTCKGGDWGSLCALESGIKHKLLTPFGELLVEEVRADLVDGLAAAKTWLDYHTGDPTYDPVCRSRKQVNTRR